jgi:hypothetical protein
MRWEIELDEDLAFQQRYWRIQRIGWAVLACLLAAAALGLLGGEGPLSQTTTSSGDLTITYDRFARRNTPTLILVRLSLSTSHPQRLQLAFNAEYVRNMAFQQVTPQPASVEATAGRVTYDFLTNSESGTVLFHFEAKPRTFGREAASLTIAGFPTIHYWQFVYP